MESIGERIKQIRKDNHLTQEEFAVALGTKRGNISKYEIDENTPSDAIVTLLKDRFNVNDNWLRNGQGEPYIEKTRDKRIEDFFKEVELGTDAFKTAFVNGLAKLTVEEWKALEKICKKLVEGTNSPVVPEEVPDNLEELPASDLESIYKNVTLPELSEKERTALSTSADEKKDA